MKTITYFKISSFLLFLFVGLQLHAQISYGVKAGVHVGNVNLDGLSKNILPIQTKAFIGETFGVFADIPLSSQFSFQPEINYTAKGFQFNEGIDLGELGLPFDLRFVARTKVNTIDIPLLLKYKIPTGGGIEPYLLAGPSINYIASANFRVRANLIADITALNMDIPLGGINRVNVAGVLGAGVALPAGSGKIMLDARFLRDLSNTVRTPIIDVAAKNTGFAFNIGYALGF
jgi:hypothetical protein